jgi:hypothetical protein
MATKSKKDRLVERATASVRTPTPERAAQDRVRKKGYRVVAVSLYDPEAEWIDHATTALRQAGNAKANRSLVVREAVLRLQEEVRDKSPEQLVQDFTQRQAKRTQAG